MPARPSNVHRAEEFRCLCGAWVAFYRRDWGGPLQSVTHYGRGVIADLGRRDIKRLFGDDKNIITLGREPSYLHPALVRWLEKQHG